LVDIIILYVDLTLKIPLLSKFQAQKSSCLLVHNGMLIITAASIGKKNSWIISSLQVELVSSIRWLTSIGGFCFKDTIGLMFVSLGSQLCSQIFVVLPSPIRLISPWARTSLPSKIDRHIFDGCGPSSASRIDELGK
jgi:hypothetical protein